MNNNNNTINAYWCKGNNFGDALVPYLINKLSDKSVVWVNHNSNTPKYIVVGSILDWGIKNAIVWGCGVMHNNTQVLGNTFHAVRGNFTKERLIKQGHKCDNIALGDPALIMPYLYNPKVDKKYKIGIFAHYIDIDDVKKRNDSNYFIINPIDDRETVIKHVLSCDVIVSSSLHGLIIADAYGIKNKWVKFGNRLAGDDSKFHDYYQSINYPDETFIDMRNNNTINLNNIEYIHKPIPDDIIPNLIHTCPFITNKMRDIILTKHRNNTININIHNISKIQELRCIHALSEIDNINIEIHPDDIHKFELLKTTFNMNYTKGSSNNLSHNKLIDISHKQPNVTIANVSKPLIYPKSILDHLKLKWNVDSKSLYSFTGLITDTRNDIISKWKHKYLEVNDSNLLYIKSSTQGRTFPTKTWDSKYYDVMLQSKFVLCPSGDFIWTYRFFESIMCGAIPIVEVTCDIYDDFIYYTMDDDIDTLKWDINIVTHNFELAYKKLTISNDDINTITNNLRLKYNKILTTNTDSSKALRQYMALTYNMVPMPPLKPLDIPIANDFLRLLYNYTDNHKIDCLLIFGTLLGIHREHNLISHDYDIDIAINGNQRLQLIPILDELIKAGCEYRGIFFDDSILKLVYKGIRIDIYIFSEIENDDNSLQCYKFKLNKCDFNHPTTITYLNKDFKTVNNIEQFLVTYYGSDWNIPKKNTPANHILIPSHKPTHQIVLISYNSTSGDAKSKAELIQIKHPLVKIRAIDMGDEFQLVDVNNMIHRGLKAKSIIHSLIQ